MGQEAGRRGTGGVREGCRRVRAADGGAHESYYTYCYVLRPPPLLPSIGCLQGYMNRVRSACILYRGVRNALWR